MLLMQESLEPKKEKNSMKKPTKEEIIEAGVLLIAICVGILVFTTTFVIAKAIIQSVF